MKPILRGFRSLFLLVALLSLNVIASAQHVINVTGGSDQNGIFEPLYFSWHYQVPINSSGWTGGQAVHISLLGPLNTLNVAPGLREIAVINADGGGNIDTTVQIPYDEGGAHTIPRPGLYQIVAAAAPDSCVSAQKFNIAPATYKSDAVGIDWSYERGGRDGGVGDIKRVFPHWMSVWNENPIGLYGTIAETDFNGNNQPSFITHSDFPGDHGAHDGNFMLIPDPDYRWAMGTSNYYKLEDDQALREIRRMEIEGETQNAGISSATNQGVSGIPLFAQPTSGDRLYVVGRWILDAGHPEVGDRCEIHPPRLLATIRNRPTVMPLTPGSACMTYAKQVDIMVNGHGGGANRYFYSLSDTLGGGGRVRDVMGDTTDYYSGDVFSSTGLSVEPFYSNGGYNRAPEYHPINDMDYEFDVPLPTPPSGATAPQIQVIKRSMDSTTVNEVVTYTNLVGGLPTVAHVVIPCQGGDNGTYARTIKFAWDKYKAPGRHFEVQIENILVKDNDDPFGDFETGEWYLWTNVGNDWINLTQLNFSSFNDTADDDVIGGLGQAHFDVYLDPGQSMYVLTEGYERDSMDSLFGVCYGFDSFDMALAIASTFTNLTEPGDNDNLGGAVLKIDNASKDNATGFFDVPSAYTDGNYYNMRVRVTYAPSPPRIELNGVPTDFGHVCLGDFEDKVVSIFNLGESPLDINQINVTGAGYTRLGPTAPFTIAGGDHVDITVRFSPTAISQGTGQIQFNSSDPCQGLLTYPMSATVDYPLTSLSGDLSFGMLPVDDRTVGYSVTKNFQINNTGHCALVISSVSVTSGASSGFSLGSQPTFPQTIQPGGALNVPVSFNPNAQGAASGVIQVQAGNDPINTGPLSINVGGTGIVPFAVATPSNTIFDPTVVGFTRTQAITLANNGPAELIVDSVNMAGADFTVSPVSLPIRLAANSSTQLTVTFAPHAVTRRSDGTLTFGTNDPNHATVTDTFCGEGVNTGFRVVVKNSSGVPYPTVDAITLSSYGITPNTNVIVKNAPLVTITPPTSCVTIQYQMEKALPASTTSGKKGSQYTLKVKVGAKAQSLSFTLAPSEFKIFTITLQ